MDKYLDFFTESESNGKKFNTAGLCVEDKHYMVNTDEKIKSIIKLIQNDSYFVINRPRQYGKTTTLNRLEKILKTRYEVISIDFEGLGNVFQSEESFCSYFISQINQELKSDLSVVSRFVDLIEIIEHITKHRQVILIIDEVDKASNNQLFLDFLGMLRSLYLARTKEKSTTFKSVILAGVHDIKNLKIKFRDHGEVKYNSPWNIAVNFDIDMSFNKREIETMLKEYTTENRLDLNTDELSEEIYKFSSGYPFLVSRICQIIDEKILPDRNEIWTKYHIQRAIKILLEENNTLFDDLIKNLENNDKLYEFMYNLLILNLPSVFNIDNPIINIGVMFGYLSKDENNNVVVSNKVIRERIYNYLVSRIDNKEMLSYNFKDNFITRDNGLDMEKVLLKFQEFMKKNYSTRDVNLLERHGVLLFLAFIKPIINGVGFDYKEVQISEERRLDIVIQYNNHKYIIETKIWHGNVAHEKGLLQLRSYLDIEDIDKEYLLIFNFNKGKDFISKRYSLDEKEIFEVVA